MGRSGIEVREGIRTLRLESARALRGFDWEQHRGRGVISSTMQNAILLQNEVDEA